ncbi:hypothetical protein M406DRAFT_249127 [Cryphonectria parasitica EP155]|uniref:DUF6594 domain-containing protein n=1 Tax=Cryphonectria parasitica (strain ATCC 38755 / EP155) TaxID=660469 RepID=A0A9P4Y8E2_CRYP1|nr:uncharacterized protein M406DRAFT_249127 [Cryphonectria parasitica EP155]KAF3768673.1 hypothetical protein M406DRAFT_249127 [Cryphonectria parasitica EP155]
MASASGSPEATPQTYVSGFGSLASFIVTDDDHKSVVYKRFDKLSTRNILYYQSELSHLQAQQDGYDMQDSLDIENDNRPDAREHRSWIRRCAGSWEEFEKAAFHSAPADHGAVTRTQPDKMWRERMDLAMRIRATLKEYQEALIRESTTTLTPSGGNAPSTYPMLSGASSSLYPLRMSTAHIRGSDYVSLTGRDEPDVLTRLLHMTLPRLFRTKPPPVLPQYNTIWYYSYERVKLVASLITTLTAIMLLFLPIYALYHTNSSHPQLSIGLIALFTVVFAVSLRAMTTASRVEIFGACAAYAAVLVVFISGDFAGGGNNGMAAVVASS